VIKVQVLTWKSVPSRRCRLESGGSRRVGSVNVSMDLRRAKVAALNLR